MKHQKWISQLWQQSKTENARGNTTCPHSITQKETKNVSLLEKLIGVVLVCATIGIAIATIQVRTTIVQTMNDITETQAVIKEKEDNALKLEQERSELSKSDRIKDVAKKQGLENNGDNVRTVK